MATIQEMREVCQLRKLNAQGELVLAGHWFSRLLIRRFSIYITWLFVRAGISANATTLLGLLFALAGVVLCVPHVLWLNVIGFLFLMLDAVLDCVDGEVARWTKKSSLKGVYLDLTSHLLCNALVSTICALHLYLLYGQIRYLVLAFVAYGAAQCRRGLRVIQDQIIRPQIPADYDRRPEGGAIPGSVLQKQPGWTQIKWSFSRFISRFTDSMTMRLASFFGILLTYAGITEPLVFFAWFSAVFGIMWVMADSLYKFYFLVPALPHVKKV